MDYRFGTLSEDALHPKGSTDDDPCLNGVTAWGIGVEADETTGISSGNLISTPDCVAGPVSIFTESFFNPEHLQILDAEESEDEIEQQEIPP